MSDVEYKVRRNPDPSSQWVVLVIVIFFVLFGFLA